MAPVMHNGQLDAGRLAPSTAAAAPSSSSSANGQPPSGGLYPVRVATPLVHVPSPTANYMVAVDAMRGAAPPGATAARSDTEGAPSWAKSHTLRFLVLVACWYACSSLTNNIGKEILQVFTFPVTLTVAQFGFIGVFTYIYGTRPPPAWRRCPATARSRASRWPFLSLLSQPPCCGGRWTGAAHGCSCH